jgi:hypothetical protein
MNIALKSLDPPRPRRPTNIWVKIFGYPLDSKILEQTLSLYGKLVSVTDDLDSRINIKTGIKHAQFESLTENIPSFISEYGQCTEINQKPVTTACKRATKQRIDSRYGM